MTVVSSSSPAARIVVVDDHALFREGVKLLLQRDPELQVVGEAGTPIEALDLVRKERPNIVLLDVDLDGSDGLDIVESLHAIAPETRVIILTGMRTPDMPARALRAGAKGFVPKEQSADLLARAIHRVLLGELWFDRSTVGNAVTSLLRRAPDSAASALTARELEIVRLVGEGLKNDAIARRLSISEKTVRNNLTVIFEKAGVEDRLHLALYAYRSGLAKLPH